MSPDVIMGPMSTSPSESAKTRANPDTCEPLDESVLGVVGCDFSARFFAGLGPEAMGPEDRMANSLYRDIQNGASVVAEGSTPDNRLTWLPPIEVLQNRDGGTYLLVPQFLQSYGMPETDRSWVLVLVKGDGVLKVGGTYDRETGLEMMQRRRDV